MAGRDEFRDRTLALREARLRRRGRTRRARARRAHAQPILRHVARDRLGPRAEQGPVEFAVAFDRLADAFGRIEVAVAGGERRRHHRARRPRGAVVGVGRAEEVGDPRARSRRADVPRGERQDQLRREDRFERLDGTFEQRHGVARASPRDEILGDARRGERRPMRAIDATPHREDAFVRREPDEFRVVRRETDRRTRERDVHALVPIVHVPERGARGALRRAYVAAQIPLEGHRDVDVLLHALQAVFAEHRDRSFESLVRARVGSVEARAHRDRGGREHVAVR